MVRIRKRTSKRQSTKQRVKVAKKVREHHRKSRRDAKNDPTWKSKKKQDPGIPNSFPYKEQLLDEIEKRRMQVRSGCIGRGKGEAGVAAEIGLTSALTFLDLLLRQRRQSSSARTRARLA